MFLRGYLGIFLALSCVLSDSAFSKVYNNIEVGEYGEGQFIHLDQCKSEKLTFLACMKTYVYDMIKEQAKHRTGGQHIDGVKNGEGVELRLTNNVSTYHIKYKAADEDKAERSGRSFGAVGFRRNGLVAYVADASDSYYLSSLEKIAKDPTQLRKFYQTILEVLALSDASGFNDRELDNETAKVAADFVAVLVAEQYRHLIGGDGELGPTFNWDDALLQVTMLASYHSGQSRNNRKMFYEGNFTDEVYDQIYDVKENGEEVSYCLYKNWKAPQRKTFEKRAIQLNDYWQFNKECKRSGINMTRSDFSNMAEGITAWAWDSNISDIAAEVAKAVKDEESNDIYESFAKFFINNRAPNSMTGTAPELIKNTVDFLMEVREGADQITASLEH